jgi:3-methylfumaryl-CoA hydratase
MWAASTLEFTGDIRIGDMVERRSRVTDIEVKQGRSGILCFVTLDHAYVSGGIPVLNERQTIVYRDNAAAPSPQAQAMAAEKGEHVRTVTPTPPLLFRYSALTFNGHRIHYDLPYATDVEGYPGLVVHGPLQATLLARFAQELAGKRPARIGVRALSSLYSTGDMMLNARGDGDERLLWTCTRVQW